MFFSLSAAAQDRGSAMPNAIFYNRDNTPFSTYSVPKGKKSLIIFFDATCDHCQKVVAQMSKRTKELKNVNVYLISQDEYRSIDYFMTNFGKPFLQEKNVVQDAYVFTCFPPNNTTIYIISSKVVFPQVIK